MPRIEHIALWTRDLPRLRDFYVAYFGARAGADYRNEAKDFASCFLEFDGGARLELMRSGCLDLADAAAGAQRHGLTHVAISVGSEAGVDALTKRLAADGYPVLDGPRRTGDGYYESVVLDPDGNRVEVTA
jgi:lactoylglutathione lyase